MKEEEREVDCERFHADRAFYTKLVFDYELKKLSVSDLFRPFQFNRLMSRLKSMSPHAPEPPGTREADVLAECYISTLFDRDCFFEYLPLFLKTIAQLRYTGVLEAIRHCPEPHHMLETVELRRVGADKPERFYLWPFMLKHSHGYLYNKHLEEYFLQLHRTDALYHPEFSTTRLRASLDLASTCKFAS